MRWFVWVMFACTDGNGSTSDSKTTSAPSDADADTDSDSDSDTDTDVDADTETYTLGPTCEDATAQPISESEFYSLFSEKFCVLWDGLCGSGGECPPVDVPPVGCTFDPDAACACLDADWQCNVNNRPSPATMCLNVYDCDDDSGDYTDPDSGDYTSPTNDSGDYTSPTTDSGIADGTVVETGDTGETTETGDTADTGT